jgi:hypothetical protein
MSSLSLAIAILVISANAPINNLDSTRVYGFLALHKQIKPVCVAQKYANADPHGDDPYGDDPHGEVHDYGIPAHSMARGKATDDVYGGAEKVSNSQHPLDNFPSGAGF